VQKLWKANFTLKLQALEFLPAPERLSLPLWTCAVLSDQLSQHHCLSTGLDSRALSGPEQAKSVRRVGAKFTCHAQLFHKPKNCASGKKKQNLPEKNTVYSERKM